MTLAETISQFMLETYLTSSPSVPIRRFASKFAPSASEVNIPPAREPSATIPTAEALLNPPPTTRPPPLDVPARDPQKSLPAYLFSVGKTYITFYKTGLRNILTNRKLLAASSAAAPPKLDKHGRASTFPSRADFVLQARTRHDIARLPVFGLVILICGEFTPLVVVAFPKLTPYTCRIPKQIDILRRTAETRREASFKALRNAAPETPSSATQQQGNGDKSSSSSSHELTGAIAKLAPGHIARTLGLTSRIWDRVGIDSPFSAALSQRAVRKIAADDRLIRRDGGVGGLIDDEVVLACEQRGMNVRDQQARNLRRRLDEWVRTTTRGGDRGAAEAGEADSATEAAVRKMLLSEEVILGKGVTT
ncbi:uncharacterized protein B0I36DRAFT_363740 [Microdochium trichocladiopsis]|uniref:Letm1 RBD domain-containing protein n=1 Tax=Microdochium trichocladiopsis TaxID=1682393 RepID=A0A9P8Y3T7_9PEZI|nr:uncharacterized protein B0I36DRAFT_363740 [Microdochium trichocladiopsis]KAH7029161.1 hypothetical protein B0I36DRAFT_363740 [Microdochium trichocladiopsis]